MIGSRPVVTLNNAAGVTASFDTPALTNTATVTFQLVVSDSANPSPAATVSIQLTPVILPFQPPPAPALTVSATSGGPLQIQWSDPTSTFFLQRSGDPSGPWENDTNTPSNVGGVSSVTVTPDIAARYWRLSDGMKTPRPARTKAPKAQTAKPVGK
jgi:hypothetical protein